MFEWISGKLRALTGVMFFSGAVLTLPCGLRAGWDWNLSEAGIRGGVDLNENDTNARALELYALLDTENTWTSNEQTFEIRLMALLGLGALQIQNDTTATIHFGPALEILHRDFPVSLALSTGPAWLMDDQLGTFDLGTRIQFASAGTLNWEFQEGWIASYTYQHLSNAHLDDQNPGVNTSLFGIGRRF